MQTGIPAILLVYGVGVKFRALGVLGKHAISKPHCSLGSVFSERPLGDAEASEDQGAKAWAGTQNESPVEVP